MFYFGLNGIFHFDPKLTSNFFTPNNNKKEFGLINTEIFVWA